MPNRVTGTTDVSGALTAVPSLVKSAIVVAKVSGTASTEIDPKKIFDISGTADAIAAFGNTSIAPDIVRVMISNGVDNIKGIIVPATSDTALADTLEVTLQDKTIKCIVTDDNTSTTIAALKTHLAMAEVNDMFRYAFVGPSAENATTQAKLIAFAKSVNCDRIFVPGPSMLDASGTVVNPQIAAAGLASVVMVETDDPALPMNGVEIAGFGGVDRVMLDAEMNALANGGVTAIYSNGGTPTIWRLVTSKFNEEGTQADPIWQEGTTRFIADYVLEAVETMLRANYKRTKNVARILKSIRDDVNVVLEDMDSREIIENYDEATLTVGKDPDDMYGALVDYEFDVVTPLYTITINQHMKL